MRSSFALLLTLALSPLACGGEDVASTEDDLTQAGKKLIGEYVEQGEGAFRGLVLTGEKASANANRFFADIDTGIVCVTTPCPTVVRVEGTFTAGTKTITLKSGDADGVAAPFLGKYNYTLQNGKLSLSRQGNTQSLEAVASYCAPETVTDDCERTAQDLLVPACLGTWSCSAEASCGWNCGSDKTCGGFAGFTCADNEFCDYEADAMCGAADQTGTCRPRPDACPLGCPAPEYQVCGCDGEKYCSECDAQAAGVDATACGSSDKSCGGIAGLLCGDDEFCDYDDAAMCGAADQMGTCKPRPDNCPLGCPAPEYQECGCDGQLYCSVCDAQAAGVDVSGHTGDCG